MRKLGLVTVALTALFVFSLSIAASPPTEREGSRSIYGDMPGTIALDNDRVIVQRFVIQPGQWTGRHTHAAHQLLVFVKGGVLTSKRTGRASIWPDGRVVWEETLGRDDGSINTGQRPIELLWVTLKPAIAVSRDAASGPTPKYGYLDYPNIPGEDILDNDLVIVQRFKMNPGDWEGIHAHNPNTFYIFIKGGQWLSKSKEHPDGVAGSAADGVVAWMDTIDLSEQHQSGNAGKNSTEVIWVALKK